MLRNTKDLENYAIRATDGEIGQLKDLLFDDQEWVVRYLLAQAGFWLSNRKVLISPMAVHAPDWLGKTLPAAITQKQVSSSPAIDTDKPLSRQSELQYCDYYGYPYYWADSGPSDPGQQPAGLAAQRQDNAQLCSCAAVTGYRLQATDGEMGHVAGFLVDEASWAIRYLLVDTSNWGLGHCVRVAPGCITGVHRQEKTVSVNLSRDEVKALPLYAPGARMDPAWERKLP